MVPNPIRVKLLTKIATLPTRGSDGAVGYDLYASEHGYIDPGERYLVATGISMVIPNWHYGRIAPRSGLALKKGIDVLAGVIDPDYRGEIKVLLINHGTEGFVINPGDRVAQMIIEACMIPGMVAVDELDETVRGDGAFASTGK